MVIAEVKSKLDAWLQGQVAVLPALGNNDVFPDYNISIGPDAQLQDIYNAYSAAPSYMSREEELSFVKGGYFSRRIGDHVAIVLNSLYYSATISSLSYMSGFSNYTDPADQFAFLEAELLQAQKDGYKVWLLFHISPGIDGYSGEALWADPRTPEFLALVEPYQDVISLTLCAHNHKDQFHLFNNNSYLIVQSPSISPIYRNFPGYRILFFLQDSFEALDWAMVYTNFTAQAQAPELVWQLEYDFRESYGLPSADGPLPDGLTAERFVPIMDAIYALPNTDSYYLYEQYYVVKYPASYSKTELACTINCTTPSLWNNCSAQVEPAMFF